MGQSVGSLEDQNTKRNENGGNLTHEVQNRARTLLGTGLVLHSSKESFHVLRARWRLNSKVMDGLVWMRKLQENMAFSCVMVRSYFSYPCSRQDGAASETEIHKT